MAATTTILLSSSQSMIATTPPRLVAKPISSSPDLPSPSQLYLPKDRRKTSENRSNISNISAVAEAFGASALSPRELPLKPRTLPPKSLAINFAERETLQATARPGEKDALNENVTSFKESGKITKARKQTLPNLLDKEASNISSRMDKIGPEPKSLKTRKKKAAAEQLGQTKIRKAKVTKPGVEKLVGKGKTAVGIKRGKKPALSTISTLLADDDRTSTILGHQDLQLKEATKRRADWTPVKDTERGARCQISKSNSKASAKFGLLLDVFGLSVVGDSAKVSHDSLSGSTSNRGAAPKRRKIELVNGRNCPPPIEKPRRSKSPKKKPQTITEKATAPFVPSAITVAPSLSEYFGADVLDPRDDGSVALMQRDTLPMKKISKPRTVSAKSKKRADEFIVLLSPETAMKKARDQDLVFGTASQLVCEDSPTFLRDLQQAFKESESAGVQQGMQEKDSGPLSLPLQLYRSNSSDMLTPGRSLWSAAARGFDESLLEANIIDLSHTPAAQSGSTEDQATKTQPQQRPAYPTRVQDDDPSVLHKASVVEKPALDELTPSKTNQSLPHSLAEKRLQKRPKSKSTAKKGLARKGTPSLMPNYQGFTDLQLNLEIAACGFKPVKKRHVMISLLEKCWECKTTAKNQEEPATIDVVELAAQDIASKAPKNPIPVKKRGRPAKAPTASLTETTKPQTPPKPRGRPRKDSVTPIAPPSEQTSKAQTPSKASVETPLDPNDEIYDSAPPTPSPRRRALIKPPKALPLSPSQTLATPKDTPAHHSRLLASITKAIMTNPPSNDPQNLTWRERILMYEPIVIEHLTAWLNQEGLGRIGQDDEVGVALVKEWCEGQSVCCLWKENLRGGQRGRW